MTVWVLFVINAGDSIESGEGMWCSKHVTWSILVGNLLNIVTSKWYSQIKYVKSSIHLKITYIQGLGTLDVLNIQQHHIPLRYTNITNTGRGRLHRKRKGYTRSTQEESRQERVTHELHTRKEIPVQCLDIQYGFMQSPPASVKYMQSPPASVKYMQSPPASVKYMQSPPEAV